MKMYHSTFDTAITKAVVLVAALALPSFAVAGDENIISQNVGKTGASN